MFIRRPKPDLLNSAKAIAGARDPAELRRVLERCPALAEADTDRRLTELIQDEEALDVQAQLLVARGFLAAYRASRRAGSTGVDAGAVNAALRALGEEASMGTLHDSVPMLCSAPLLASEPLPLIDACPLAEIDERGESLPPETLLPLAQAVLRWLRPVSEPRLYAAIGNLVADGWYQLNGIQRQPRPDAAEGQDRAAALRQAAALSTEIANRLSALPGAEEAAAWREALQRLDHIWSALAQLDPGHSSDAAIRFYEQALDEPGLARVLSGGAALTTVDWSRAPEERARFLHTLGGLYNQRPTGDYQANVEHSIELLQQAIQAAEAVSAHQAALSRTSLGNSFLYRVAGERVENIRKALGCFEDAEAVHQANQDTGRLAELDHSLAVAYRMLAQETLDPDEADRLIGVGLGYAQTALDGLAPTENPLLWAALHSEMGTLSYHRRTDPAPALDAAVDHYRAALQAIRREDAPILWANTNNDLANALGERANALGERANTLSERANALSDPQADLAETVGLYQAALTVFTRAAYPPMWAYVSNNLGATLVDMGHQAAAERCFNAALEVYTAEAFPGEAKLAAQNLGNLKFAEGDWQRAWAAYDLALQASERMYQASESEVGKRAEQSKRFLLAQRAAYTRVMLHDPDAAEAASAADAACAADAALVIIEQNKTRLLLERLQARAGAHDRPRGVSETQWQAYQAAAGQVRRAAAERVRNLPLTMGRLEPQPSSAYDDRPAHEAAARALAAAVAAIRQVQPNFRQDLDLEGIRAVLPDDQTALVAFCLTERGGYALILTRLARHVQAVPLPQLTPRWLNDWLSGEPPADAPRGLWRPTEPQPGSWLHACGPEPDLAVITQRLNEAGAALVEPVAAALPAGIRKLMLMPSGGLFLIPLHAAPLHAVPLSTTGSLTGGQLLDQYEVSYLPSARVLLSHPNRPADARTGRLFGVITPQPAPPGSAQDRGLPALKLGQAMQAALRRLAGAAGPLADTAGPRAWQPVELLSGADCTVEAVLNGAPGAAAMHFYGHGHFNPRAPLESSLSLAGGEPLTLERLHGLPALPDHEQALSSIRLLTLTACEAGQIDTAELPEEYLGLPAGFMQAGIPCVISALWPVKEAPSVLLMQAFYHHYSAGCSPSAALRAAQQEIRGLTYADLAQRSLFADPAVQRQCPPANGLCQGYQRHVKADPTGRPFENPYFWAGFTVNGMG